MAGVQAAAAGKTAVENNFLSSSDITTFLDKYAKAKTEEEKEKLREELKQKDAAQQEQAQATRISVNEQKAELEKLKALMVSPDCSAECRSLAVYSISQLDPVANNTELHQDNLAKAGLAAVIFGITDGISSGAGKAKSQEVSATVKAEKSALDDILQGESQAAKNTVTTNKAESAEVSAGKVTSGAENVATYPSLKDDLVQQNLDSIAKQDQRLAAVVQGDNGKLNYGVGSGTKAEADRLGQIWVGDGARTTNDGSGLMSADGTRVYRYPSSKDNSPYVTTGIQANFETFKIDPATGDKVKIGNGHLNIE
jgi:hypothetical protein